MAQCDQYYSSYLKQLNEYDIQKQDLQSIDAVCDEEPQIFYVVQHAVAVQEQRFPRRSLRPVGLNQLEDLQCEGLFLKSL